MRMISAGDLCAYFKTTAKLPQTAERTEIPNIMRYGKAPKVSANDDEYT